MSIDGVNEHRFHKIERKVDGLRDLLGRLVIGDNTDIGYWDQIREKRNLLLSQSDWTQGNDSPLTPSKKTEWIAYRSQLSDITENFEDAADVVFPDPPEPTPLPE